MNPIHDFWNQFYASLTVDKLLCAVIVLLALLIVAVITAVKRGHAIESLRQQIASIPETKPVPPMPEPPQQHNAPVPVQFVEVPSDRVLDMARELCDNADTAYEAACREMDEQVQRARAFYRLQQDKAYAVLRELRDSERALRPSVQPQVIDVQPEPEPAAAEPEPAKKPQPKPAKDDPYNLGSLDDLDEE